MASLDPYRRGPRQVEEYPVDSTTAAISTGDFLVFATAGYVKQAAAGELPIGVAMDSVASPSADGDISIRVDVSETSVYEYSPDAGTVTQALVGATCDIGGPQSINIDASADDIVKVHDIDSDANTVFVSLTMTRAGVA